MEVCLPNKEAGLELELVRPLSTCELISLAISTPKIDQTGPSTGSRNDHGRPVDARKRSGAPIDDLGRHLRGVSTEVEHNRQRRALRFLGFVATTSCLLGSVSSSVAGGPPPSDRSTQAAAIPFADELQGCAWTSFQEGGHRPFVIPHPKKQAMGHRRLRQVTRHLRIERFEGGRKPPQSCLLALCACATAGGAGLAFIGNRPQ